MFTVVKGTNILLLAAIRMMMANPRRPQLCIWKNMTQKRTRIISLRKSNGLAAQEVGVL
jgi:hypothetical protein